MNRAAMIVGTLAVLSIAACGSWGLDDAPWCEVISSTICDVDADGRAEILEVLLTSGRRYVDDQLWCGLGDKWEGQFAVRVRRGQRVLSFDSLNELVGREQLFFHAPQFELVLQDLNLDGEIDFNLGQYSGCNGNKYFLFTISAEGQIRRLGSGAYYVFDHRNSTPLIRLENGLAGFPYYSQSSALYETTWYQWDGKDFNWVKTTTSCDPP